MCSHEKKQASPFLRETPQLQTLAPLKDQQIQPGGVLSLLFCTFFRFTVQMLMHAFPNTKAVFTLFPIILPFVLFRVSSCSSVSG